MFPVSPAFLAALRQGHAMTTRVEVWNGATQVLANLPIDAGAVTVDGTGSGVRRKLDVTVTPDVAGLLFDVLAPVGTELVVYRGVRFVDRTVEWVPLGVFGIDSQSLSYGVDGALTLSCPDRWARVQRARFLTPTTTSGSAISEALRLATEGVPTPSSSTVTSVVTSPVSVWERDRDQAINDLAKSAGAEIFYDVQGALLARDVPRLTSVPVWRVDARTEGAVMLSGARTRDRSRTYNAVVVTAASTDGSAPFAPQIAYDNDPTSPTWVGGPFGQVPTFYSSPLITTAAQALAAAAAILSRTTALAAQLSLTAAVNPALEAGDTILAVFPDRHVEYHLLDTFAVPLDPQTSQPMTTRSTRPDGDVPDAA